MVSSRDRAPGDILKYSGMSVSEFMKKDVDIEDFYGKLKNRLKKMEKMGYIRPVDYNISEKGKLGGLPFTLKDSICSKNDPTYAGSKILEGYKPPFDATVAKKIKEAGGVIFAKTHQDEFAFGTASTNCAFTTPKNPWDTERCCGGSSGGAAGLSVALDLPHINLGESTGGSISEPVSFTGAVGLTPTYGTVSRYGLISFANSLDKIGPITRSVEDAAIGLDIISGKDPMDQTTVDTEGNYAKDLDGDLKDTKIGIPEGYFKISGEGVSETVKEAVKVLEDLGADIQKVELEMTEAALPAYYIIAPAEASTNLAKYCGMRYGMEEDPEGSFREYFSKIRGKGFGDEVKRRVILGTYTRMAGYRDKYYLKALKVRKKIINDFKSAFKEVDVLAAPTAPIVAPCIDEIEGMSPVEQYKLDKLTAPINLAGMPQISVPCGFHRDMPVGLHLMGDHFQEKNIIKVGHRYEKERGSIKYPEV